MNGTFLFVLSLVAIVMSARLVDTWMRQKKRPPAENHEDLAEALAKIEELEDRVRVLERIVTENRFDLKQEIDKL
jgi:hypothetical protein